MRQARRCMAWRLYLEDGAGLRGFTRVFASAQHHLLAGQLQPVYKVFRYDPPE